MNCSQIPVSVAGSSLLPAVPLNSFSRDGLILASFADANKTFKAASRQTSSFETQLHPLWCWWRKRRKHLVHIPYLSSPPPEIMCSSSASSSAPVDVIRRFRRELIVRLVFQSKCRVNSDSDAVKGAVLMPHRPLRPLIISLSLPSHSSAQLPSPAAALTRIQTDDVITLKSDVIHSNTFPHIR